MLCTFCPLTILDDFYRIPEKSPKSSADKMYRACESKDETLKKIRTLHFPEASLFKEVEGKAMTESCRRKQGVSRGLRPNLLILSKGAMTTSLSLF